MPVYEYECEQHGVFELIKSVAQVREEGLCPLCDQAGQRLISAPHVSSMARSQIVARDRNEQSRHEPRLASSPGACSHTGPCNHGKRATPGQLKTYTGKRPWVIEHA